MLSSNRAPSCCGTTAACASWKAWLKRSGSLPAAWSPRRSWRKAGCASRWIRSEEHTSELQSLMRISYAVFCLKKKKTTNENKKGFHECDTGQDLVNTDI